MPAKNHNPEGMIGELREVEVMLGQGGTIAEACRRISASEQTYYRWRKESPWANGYNESFNKSLRDGELFNSLAEARVLIEAWRRQYNTVRPHSSLGYRPPTREAQTTPLPASGSASLNLRPAMPEETTMR
jgi:putative transposase